MVRKGGEGGGKGGKSSVRHRTKREKSFFSLDEHDRKGKERPCLARHRRAGRKGKEKKKKKKSVHLPCRRRGRRKKKRRPGSSFPVSATHYQAGAGNRGGEEEKWNSSLSFPLASFLTKKRKERGEEEEPTHYVFVAGILS